MLSSRQRKERRLPLWETEAAGGGIHDSRGNPAAGASGHGSRGGEGVEPAAAPREGTLQEAVVWGPVAVGSLAEAIVQVVDTWGPKQAGRSGVDLAAMRRAGAQPEGGTALAL